MSRWMLIFKYIKIELYKILHPNTVMSIKIDDKVVQPEVVRQTIFFLICFFMVLALSALVLILLEKDVLIGLSSAICSLGDIGPGFGDTVGPMGNYSALTTPSKLIFIINMLVGRLEVIPFIVLFQKDIWNLK